MRRILPVLAMLCAAGITPAAADWTATGACGYVDREFDASGFTGVEPIRPVRFAVVEVIDGSSVLASSTTDEDGNYSFTVIDSQTRNIYLRCLSRHVAPGGIPVEVRSGSSAGTVWSMRGPTINSHPPTQNVNAGMLVAIPGTGGEAFNLYDVALRAAEFINHLRGGPATTPLLLVNFNASNPTLSVFNGTAVVAARNAGYDDTVILHEIGHYVVFRFSASDNPGGSHQLSNCNQDLRLAFDEGHATYFGCSVRRHFGLPNSSTYVRTTGQAGPGNLQFSFDVETQLPFVCYGATSETTVYTALWDIGDGPASTDGSPGSDEPWDLLQGQDPLVFETMDVYLPTASNRSLEDFWDGWFHPTIDNGLLAEMRGIFRPLGVEYEPDLFEPNDTVSEAALIVPGPAIYDLTFWADREAPVLVGEADPDYFMFDVVGGSPYTIETLNLRGDANTSLTLYASNGTTVLASNDDRSGTDKSSLIAYTPPEDTRLYLRSVHGSGFGIYGSYDLRVAGAATGTDEDQDGFTTANDCADDNPSIHPGAIESCNLTDDDCDQVVDEGFDQDSDGWTTCAGDCNNVNAQIHPEAAEVCNGIDDDCDLEIDEGGFTDTDDDGQPDCYDDDDDEDGVADVGDCAPTAYLASAPPAEVSGRVELLPAAAIRLLWDPVAETNVYNIYRAQVPFEGPRDYDGACLLAEGVGTSFDDAAEPPPGSLFFYVTGGANLCGAGSLGESSDGQPRTVSTPCAPQNRDTDLDTVADLVDTCPQIADPAQADGDHDGRGDLCDNCPAAPNGNQADADGDSVGDACQDGDVDGHPQSTDCDDADPAIHPGAAEVFNGLDDDCNGSIDDVVETVAIVTATWQAASGRLTVEATSNYPVGAVTLTVTGLGAMTWEPTPGVYRLVVQPIADPGSVTVTSTAGGSATSPVTPL